MCQKQAAGMLHLACCVLFAILVVGCYVGDVSKVKVGGNAPLPESAAVYFKVLEGDAGPVRSWNQDLILEILGKAFVDVYVIATPEEVAQRRPKVLLVVRFTQPRSENSVVINSSLTLELHDRGDRILFTGRNASTRLNWMGESIEYESATVKLFMPVLRRLMADTTVVRYVRSQ